MSQEVMKVILPTFLLLLPLPVQAGPYVVGYERFHSQNPSAEGGALLYSELGCANCHGNSQVVIPRKGPSLENLSSRVDRDWVVKFLKDPTRRTIRWRIEVGELDALLRKAINMRRLDLGVPVAAHFIVTLVVRKDVDNARGLRSRNM